MAKKTDRPTVSQPARIRWGRIALLLGGIVALYLIGQSLIEVILDQLNLHVRARNEPMLHMTVMAAAAMYIFLLAIPFVPGAEIGLGLLLVFGGKISFLVYLCTVTSLTFAYLIGRLIPPEPVAWIFGSLGLARPKVFVQRLAPLPRDERITLLTAPSPTRLAPYLVRYRFLALAILLNMPGNIVLGGGGGIAMLAGMTRLFPFPAYLLTVLLAIAPVPLFIHLTG